MKASLLLLCSFLASTLLLPNVSTAQDPASLNEFILREMATKNIPGISLAIVENGETKLRSYGVRKAGEIEMVDENTVFEAASLSKPVFALLVLEMADAGLIDLDRPIHEYVDNDNAYGPDFFENDSHRGITARMVLSHTSGLPNGGPVPGRVHFEPGSQFAYSGTGFRYLAAAIVEITQRPLNELLDDYIFTPLQMHDSSFVWREELESDVAWGHDADGEVSREILHLAEAFPEGGLVTTIVDYLKFINHLTSRFNEGDPTVQSMLTPGVVASDLANRGQMRWGLGWGVEQAGLGSRFWHTGSNGAFKSFVIFSPEQETMLLFFANAVNGLEIIDGLLDITIGATPLSGLYQPTISNSMQRSTTPIGRSN